MKLYAVYETNGSLTDNKLVAVVPANMLGRIQINGETHQSASVAPQHSMKKRKAVKKKYSHSHRASPYKNNPTIGERIYQKLSANPDQKFSVRALSETPEFKGINLDSISAMVCKMAADNVIKRVEPGRYAIPV